MAAAAAAAAAVWVAAEAGHVLDVLGTASEGRYFAPALPGEFHCKLRHTNSLSQSCGGAESKRMDNVHIPSWQGSPVVKDVLLFRRKPRLSF